MRVVWDDEKNAANQEKHGVSFEEASVLITSDRDYLEIFDELHSDEEDRFIATGPIARGLVVVVYTEVEDDVLRMISARWATKREISMCREYFEEQGP